MKTTIRQHKSLSLSSSSGSSSLKKQSSGTMELQPSLTFEADRYEVQLSWCERLKHARMEYEKRSGGSRRARAHFLTNRFYMDPHIEVGFQEWCTIRQLPSSRKLLLLMVMGLVLYQTYSAAKGRDPAVWVSFAFRIGATVFLAAIVVALFFVRVAQQYWKHLLSFGIIVLLSIECYYRSNKLAHEGLLLQQDSLLLLQNVSFSSVTAAMQQQVESKTFTTIFKDHANSQSQINLAASIGMAMRTLQDEVLIWHNRPWPMWTVIMSVVLRIDVVLIFPSLVIVTGIYLGLSGFQDVQTTVLLFCMLSLLMYLGKVHDRFLRQTYVQMEDSRTENTTLRERLKMLSLKANENDEDSEVIITTPMETVLHKLHKIRSVLEKGKMGQTLGPILENVIDTLARQQSHMSHGDNGGVGTSTFDKLNKLAGVDADVTSWLIDQAGLGDRYGGSSRSRTASSHSFSKHKASSSVSNLHMMIPTHLLELNDDVVQFLGTLEDWDLDVLELRDMTNGKPLFVLASAIISKNDLLLSIQCSNQTFSNFISRIEGGYLQNPYHNSAHAADVLNGCYHFVTALKLKDVITTEEMFALLIAATIHDFEHPGVSNNFLIKTKHALAIEYNDDSVCERMHVARAFAVMHEEGAQCNIFKRVSDENYVAIRRTIIEIVMVTDLSKHLDYTARIRSMAANYKNNNVMSDAKILMQIAIKSSDLGHCAKKLAVHIKWTELISEEMFLQGDREKKVGCKVSAFCDRNESNIPKSQVGFFTVIINPFFSAIVDLDQRFDPIKQAVLANYSHWRHETGDASTKRRLSHVRLIINSDETKEMNGNQGTTSSSSSLGSTKTDKSVAVNIVVEQEQGETDEGNEHEGESESEKKKTLR